jgi:hypothetical protein
MIGILFHGPEIFDSGWACRIIAGVSRISDVRCVLAGTMGRTAVIDSGLQGIESPGSQPSRILRDLHGAVDSVLFANYAKSEQSGLMHAAMILEKADVEIPLLQVECSGHCYVEWIEGSSPALIQMVQEMGFSRRERLMRPSATWERNRKIYRRIDTAAAGEFLLVDGIVVGTALGGEIIIECEGRRIVHVRGVEIKPHGIEKLKRLGGIDLRTAKLASTASIRRTAHTPRITPVSGKGMVFVDHAGMQVYDLVQNREGAVTVGDDTTAVVGDVLYRFQIPLIGITDGDQDTLLGNTRLTPGSTVFTVREDDSAGLRIHSEIFRHQLTTNEGFESVRERISLLIREQILQRQDY